MLNFKIGNERQRNDPVNHIQDGNDFRSFECMSIFHFEKVVTLASRLRVNHAAFIE